MSAQVTIRRLGHVCIMLAAYARLTELRAINHSVITIAVQPQDIEDLNRLEAWWQNLGETRQETVIQWKNEMFQQVEGASEEWVSDTSAGASVQNQRGS